MRTEASGLATKTSGSARPLTDEEGIARAAQRVVDGGSTFCYSLRRRKKEGVFVCSLAGRYAARGFQVVAAVNIPDAKHALAGEAWFICRPGRGTHVFGVVEMKGPGQ